MYWIKSFGVKCSYPTDFGPRRSNNFTLFEVALCRKLFYDQEKMLFAPIEQKKVITKSNAESKRILACAVRPAHIQDVDPLLWLWLVKSKQPDCNDKYLKNQQCQGIFGSFSFILNILHEKFSEPVSNSNIGVDFGFLLLKIK